jgi:intracellular sulfur oxidation DsrE/DsrF family protein
MKTLLKTIALAALTALPLTTMTAEPEKSSADKAHKVVFEVSIDGAEKWQGALRNIENTRKELGKETIIEVVTHGKGVGMLLVKTSVENAELKAKLEQLHADGVVFAACQNTMKREKLEKKDLVELSTTVPSGVSEVVRKQAAGYAYIKSGG